MKPKTTRSPIGWHNCGAIDPVHVQAMRVLYEAATEAFTIPEGGKEPSSGKAAHVASTCDWMYTVACDPIFVEEIPHGKKGESLVCSSGDPTPDLELRRNAFTLAKELIHIRFIGRTSCGSYANIKLLQLVEVVTNHRIKALKWKLVKDEI